MQEKLEKVCSLICAYIKDPRLKIGLTMYISLLVLEITVCLYQYVSNMQYGFQVMYKIEEMIQLLGQ